MQLQFVPNSLLGQSMTVIKAIGKFKPRASLAVERVAERKAMDTQRTLIGENSPPFQRSPLPASVQEDDMRASDMAILEDLMAAEHEGAAQQQLQLRTATAEKGSSVPAPGSTPQQQAAGLATPARVKFAPITGASSAPSATGGQLTQTTSQQMSQLQRANVELR